MDATLFMAEAGFQFELDGNMLLINYKDENGDLTATLFRIKRDEFGYYSFDRPGVGDTDNFRVDSNGKILEQ